MKDIKEYLKKSGYDKFILLEDLSEIPIEDIQNKASDEISENKDFDFYFILKGHLDVFYPDKNGKNHLLARVYPEDYQLGGLPKYFKREYNNLNNYIASVSKDAAFYKINKKKINELLKDPEFIGFVFEKYFELSSKIIQENYFRSIFTLEEYLAYILYEHATDGQYTVTNYSIFSNLLKCDRTNLYRCLTSLEDQGIIEKDGKTIKILSFEELEYIFSEKL